MQNNNTEVYLSLYDFLGKPAGLELGKQVAVKAVESKIQIISKQVSNPKYTGDVKMYPETFLKEYFSNIHDF